MAMQPTAAGRGQYVPPIRPTAVAPGRFFDDASRASWMTRSVATVAHVPMCSMVCQSDGLDDRRPIGPRV